MIPILDSPTPQLKKASEICLISSASLTFSMFSLYLVSWQSPTSSWFKNNTFLFGSRTSVNHLLCCDDSVGQKHNVLTHSVLVGEIHHRLWRLLTQHLEQTLGETFGICVLNQRRQLVVVTNQDELLTEFQRTKTNRHGNLGRLVDNAVVEPSSVEDPVIDRETSGGDNWWFEVILVQISTGLDVFGERREPLHVWMDS
ncbi:hypothetical protein WICPIJ_004528 [Wickerhamomyces pijperi]|uniref:Uncharacterized protein n=1 Tax=Wickerhamomyces pijperi TaxID=599730 RepID=A0A9P8Q7G6_WICPI|nr:hypothetical protein WICPIJ_004528 [Wickerhamomyces pijperi]